MILLLLWPSAPCFAPITATCLQLAWSAAGSCYTDGVLARRLLEDTTGAAVEQRTCHKATLWRSRGFAGGRGLAGQVETTTTRRMDRLTARVESRSRAPGSSLPAPVPTTLSKSSTSTNGLFSTTNTDTIMSLTRRETLGLRATGLTVAPRPQLLAGKPFNPCDSQLSHGSVAGQTHSKHALQCVCTQLNGFDGWKQDGEHTMTLGWYFASTTLHSVLDSEKMTLLDHYTDCIFRVVIQVNIYTVNGCFSVRNQVSDHAILPGY